MWTQPFCVLWSDSLFKSSSVCKAGGLLRGPLRVFDDAAAISGVMPHELRIDHCSSVNED